MTEGDFTDDQFAALRKTGVTSVILHEDAFPAKVSLFPFGPTLRRHLANPRLRLLAHAGGAWAFAVCDNPVSDSSLVARHSSLESPTRHWGVRPPQANAGTKVRSFAEIHREGYGWLVRAETGRDLVLVSSFADADGSVHAATNRFPAIEGAGADSWRLAFLPALDPGSNLWTRLETPGEARISYVAFARDPALGGLPGSDSDGSLFKLPAVDLYHEFGSTVPVPSSGGDLLCGANLSFAGCPPCTAVEGPWLPLAVPAGRYEAVVAVAPPDGADPAVTAQPFRLDGVDGVDDLVFDRTGATFSYDGTSPVSFRVSYDGSAPGVLSALFVVSSP
jgi:hypothetical protein